MTQATSIRDLFLADVTRPIPPVVWFNEQSPEKLASEVSEYIITGGWNDGHPNKRRIPIGIHEHYVNLLRAITAELDKVGGPDLPTCWISGFYGSGKSSFAKLLGLALDGVALPDGRALSEALIARDTTERRAELREAWDTLRRKIDPIAVVFDMAGTNRDGEHLHHTAVRLVQERLGYCKYPTVADFELKLERDGEWTRFEQVARDTLKRPWSEAKLRKFAEEDFSLVMSRMFPDHYVDPTRWFEVRAGTSARTESPDDAVKAIGDMLRLRRPGRDTTLFLVVDEVSQFVLANKDRLDRLRAFASALGSGLRGKAWLMALGQQKIDEDAGEAFLVWAKDRFPSQLRIHLDNTNIRDVVHRRLLQKTPAAEKTLRGLFETHRADLKLFAYKCEAITAEDFIEVYPLLPGYVDLILDITSKIRDRSTRAAGDDQAIRGLLQLLGELFRSQRLADRKVGDLITLEHVYEIQHTALDSETQSSMGRLLAECADDASGFLVRVAKVVAMLEQVQDEGPATTRELIAQCLFDRLNRGGQVSQVSEALEELSRRNLVSFSEKLGYKIQSTAGDEWVGERRDMGVGGEAVSEAVQHALRHLLAEPERPRLQGRPFAWKSVFSDGQRSDDVVLVDPRDDAAVWVDLRFLTKDERKDTIWIPRSSEHALQNRLVWVCGERAPVVEVARELGKSRAMVKKYHDRRESLPTARRNLLDRERENAEALEKRLRTTIADRWMDGQIYFRGRSLSPGDLGSTFANALVAVAERVLPEIYPYFTTLNLNPAEALQPLRTDLAGISPVLVRDLGIFELDAGRYDPTCSGLVPRQIRERIEAEGGLTATNLLAHFCGPPYGYTVNVIKACVAGLLRAGKIRITREGGVEFTVFNKTGVLAAFEKEREFRRNTFYPAQVPPNPQLRAKICKLLEQHFAIQVERDDNLIADAVSTHFPEAARNLRDVETRLIALPGKPEPPAALIALHTALEAGVRSCRQSTRTVETLGKHLDALRDGLTALAELRAELTDDARKAVQLVADVRDHQAAQLQEVGRLDSDGQAALERIAAQLARERPWKDIAVVDADVQALRAAYVAERHARITWQETQVEQARARLRGRDGFTRLSSDAAHKVLGPLTRVSTGTGTEAIAPSLQALHDPFLQALARAEADAGTLLDELLSQVGGILIRKVDLHRSLQNRELKTEAEVETLVDEIREQLLAPLRGGSHVRIV